MIKKFNEKFNNIFPVNQGINHLHAVRMLPFLFRLFSNVIFQQEIDNTKSDNVRWRKPDKQKFYILCVAKKMLWKIFKVKLRI